MKHKLPFLTIATIAAVGISIPAFTNVGGAPTNKSGSPSSNGNTCAVSGCHTGGPAISTQTIDITTDIPATGFEENTDYTITITADANGSVGSKIGFEASVESTSGVKQGLLSTLDSRTAMTGSSITHRGSSVLPTSGVNTWSFNWNSSTAEDQSTIYVAVNFANGNSSTSGDAIGTATLALNKASGIGVEEFAISNFTLYPNPATDIIRMDMDLRRGEKVSYQIIAVDGSIVLEQPGEYLAAGEHTLTIPVNDMPSGYYIAHITAGNTTKAERFIVR